MFGRKKEPEIEAFLGKGAGFNGKLIFKGSVRIDGDFKGEIEGGTLVVGEGAHIVADITADSALISGDVYGNLEIREKLAIYSTGRVFGNVNATVFAIKEGGAFEGHSCMKAKSGTVKRGIEDSDDSPEE